MGTFEAITGIFAFLSSPAGQQLIQEGIAAGKKFGEIVKEIIDAVTAHPAVVQLDGGRLMFKSVIACPVSRKLTPKQKKEKKKYASKVRNAA